MLCSISSISSASSSDAEFKKINEQVWIPFFQAYKNNDGVLINSVHEGNALAINIDANRIMLSSFMFKKRLENFYRWKQESRKQDFSVSFSNRMVNGDWAYDVGIYRQERIIEGETRVAYGTFFMTLHKSNGKWKIFSDADTQQFKADEESFKEGKILRLADS